MSPDLLNLLGYEVLAVDTNEHDYHIKARAIGLQGACIHCKSSNIVGFGRREQMVRDLPTHGKRVGVYIDTRRFQCRACAKTFYEELPKIDEKRAMTKRLSDWFFINFTVIIHLILECLALKHGYAHERHGTV